MKLRKLTALVLACVLLIGAVPVTAYASSDDFIINNGVLTYYAGRGGHVTIPSGVTEIGQGAFFGCNSLTSVTIPNSVTTIGDSAFSFCRGLTSVTIPNSVTKIGSYAFESCSVLTSVVIPDSVTTIGDYAFSGCLNMTSATIGNGVTEIGEYAFHRCDRLTSVAIGNSVARIGEYAFYDCYSLTGVTIPGSVTTIGSGAFKNCARLTNVTIPNSVTTIDNFTFSDCASLTGVTIPNSVTEIGEDAFKNCTSLTSITIPGSVTYASIHALDGCTGLTDIYFTGSKAQWEELYLAYASVPGYVTIHYNAGTDPSTGPISSQEFDISSGVLWKYNGKGGDVTIPNGVTRIDSGAFYGCTGLTSVTIPDSVDEVDWGAFDGCTSLTNFIVSSGNRSLTSVGGVLFSKDQTDLHCYPAGRQGSYTVPGSVVYIGNYAFVGCTGLTGITIPSSVDYICGFAFFGCSSLTDVTIFSGVTYIGEHVFDGCNDLTDIYFTGSKAQWEAIGTQAIGQDYGYEALDNITIHYNSTGPTAYAVTQTITIDGRPVQFQCYALKDANGNQTNYVKLRDVASLLSGTDAQFNVGWNGAVNVETGRGYVPNGAEMSSPFTGDRTYQPNPAETRINGSAADLAAILLTDDAGGGHTYYQLRDLGRTLGFNVGWTAARGMFIETDKPYTDAD